MHLFLKFTSKAKDGIAEGEVGYKGTFQLSPWYNNIGPGNSKGLLKEKDKKAHLWSHPFYVKSTHPHLCTHYFIFTKVRKYSDTCCEQHVKVLKPAFRWTNMYANIPTASCVQMHLCTLNYTERPLPSPSERKQALLSVRHVPGSMLNAFRVVS